MEMILLAAINLVVILLWGWSLSKVLPSVTIERHAPSDNSSAKPDVNAAAITWGSQAWQQQKAA